MSIVLRPYQEDFVNKIRGQLQIHKRIICCAATGSGKTKTFVSITKTVIEKGRTVLIISESLKIFGQIKKEIENARYISDGVKDMYINPNFVYIAMAQTLSRRPEIIKQFIALGDKLLIIADEVHVGTSSKLLLQLLDAFHLGFTATPDYKNAKHLPKIYNGIAVGPQPQELVEMGFLAPYYHYERKVVDLKTLKKSNTGDFTEQSQEVAFEKKEVFDGLLEDLMKFEFKKCIIYCASIKHCRHTVEALRKFGYQCSEVHSKNPKSDFELFQFTQGPIKICVSVGILTKGFDEPQIDLVVLHRATTSLSLYCQMVGRGARIFPGKTRFTVLDYGGNATRHNLWNFEHDWANMWNGKIKKPGSGVAPIKCCPKCGFMMHPTKMKCEGCGFEFKAPEPTKKQTELIEVTNQYNALRGRKISTLTAPELVSYVKFTNRKPYGKRIAVSKGDAFLNEYAQLMGWTYGWWNHIVADDKIPYHDITIK